jgi:hypothetical protein
MPKQLGSLVLFELEELAQFLGVEHQEIEQELEAGKLKGRCLAHRWFVTEDNLRAYFAARKQKGNAVNLRSQNQRALALLRAWQNQSDELGQAWWDDFERDLAEHRFSLLEAA